MGVISCLHCPTEDGSVSAFRVNVEIVGLSPDTEWQLLPGKWAHCLSHCFPTLVTRHDALTIFLSSKALYHIPVRSHLAQREMVMSTMCLPIISGRILLLISLGSHTYCKQMSRKYMNPRWKTVVSELSPCNMNMFVF